MTLNDEEDMMDLIEHGESCHLEYEAIEANGSLKVFFTSRITGVPKGIVLPMGPGW
jgi:acyl-coenzyme A synthetase/AMP-(fatty) acid ligase